MPIRLILVESTVLVWVVVEATLLFRDRARNKGHLDRDGGTRRLVVVGWFLAFIFANVIGNTSVGLSAWHFGAGHVPIGLALMWLGLGLRIWSVVTLGASFRTTVEVDSDQAVVSKGPYRWVRHPSYTGLLMIAAGYGIAGGNWVSLAILLVVPLATMLYRIRVEEAVLVEILGPAYVDYQQGTKRLVPGLW
jgi:protein-S-isoprenylcysteine O-methyltransferase Ste14